MQNQNELARRMARNAELCRMMKNGDEEGLFVGALDHVPNPRFRLQKKIEKDPEAIRKLYGEPAPK